ncbi:trinucleotide repeat-containing gene 6B protein-like [Lutra lutra]|uniref:trinucleotide repeat-containing gene 6B protein-like n=1 Tax=Lutra lutra TaxID=9657 RepID=UPI001FD5D885|nr:trinucleotide repeat-containing gene 6B protein-like [Lutra lutra]
MPPAERTGPGQGLYLGCVQAPRKINTLTAWPAQSVNRGGNRLQRPDPSPAWRDSPAAPTQGRCWAWGLGGVCCRGGGWGCLHWAYLGETGGFWGIGGVWREIGGRYLELGVSGGQGAWGRLRVSGVGVSTAARAFTAPGPWDRWAGVPRICSSWGKGSSRKQSLSSLADSNPGTSLDRSPVWEVGAVKPPDCSWRYKSSSLLPQPPPPPHPRSSAFWPGGWTGSSPKHAGSSAPPAVPQALVRPHICFSSPRSTTPALHPMDAAGAVGLHSSQAVGPWGVRLEQVWEGHKLGWDWCLLASLLPQGPPGPGPSRSPCLGPCGPCSCRPPSSGTSRQLLCCLRSWPSSLCPRPRGSGCGTWLWNVTLLPCLQLFAPSAHHHPGGGSCC